MNAIRTIVGSTTLELVQGDITALPVDAIVNAANVFLRHGGGVAAAIVRRGGAVIQDESDAVIARLGRPLETGDAVLTTGGNLPAKFVIHTAGPIWGEQEDGESDRLLRRAIRSSLALADQEGLRSIAFPAISTGVYRFPVERAAKLMLMEAASHLREHSKLARVVFCLYDRPTFQVFQRVLRAAD